MGSCFQCQSGNLEIADTFRVAVSLARAFCAGVELDMYVRVRAWLDGGTDTSRGTPCEPLKSAFRRAEEMTAPFLFGVPATRGSRTLDSS